MIYKIDNNYYVKVGAKYVKLDLSLDKKGELIMTPTKEKIESNKDLRVKEINFNNEKEEIIKSLKKSYYRNED